jgi:hypothetical protein
MQSLVLAAVVTLHALPGAAADVERGAGGHEARMLDQINAERERRGLPVLRRNRRLDAAAAEHTRRMARAGRIAHELRGEPALRDRVAATGLRFDAVAENVGFSGRIESLHPNLMRSRSHRANLLSPRYDAIGIAILHAGDRWYVTQDFAHTTSDATVAEAERIFADAIAELRRRRGLRPVVVETPRSFREAACAMARRDDLDAEYVPREPGQRSALVFTAFEPGALEGRARRLATDADVDRIAVGACHRETPSYPSGVFWFAVAY